MSETSEYSSFIDSCIFLQHISKCCLTDANHLLVISNAYGGPSKITSNVNILQECSLLFRSNAVLAVFIELLSQQEKQFGSFGWFTILLSSTLVLNIRQYVDTTHSAVSVHAIAYGLNILLSNIYRHLLSLTFVFEWSDHLTVIRLISSVSCSHTNSCIFTVQYYVCIRDVPSLYFCMFHSYSHVISVWA